MKSKSTVIYNYIMSILLTVSQVLFSLVSLPYISRILQPAGVGQISFATSIISNCLIVSQLGIPTYGIRECAKYKDDKEMLSKTVQELLLINFFMCMVTYIFLGIAVLIFDQLYAIKKIIWILSINIITTMLGVEWLYRGLEKYSYITVRSLIFNIFSVILLPIFVRSSNDIYTYAFLSVFAGIGSSICNFINLNRIIILRRKSYSIKKHLKPIFLFWLTSIAITVYTNLDVIMLGFMRTDIEVGYYNTAIKIKAILVKLTATLGTVLLPKASYYLKSNLHSEFIEIGRKAIHIVLIITIPLTVYFIIFAKECILLVAGEAYLPSVFPMQILMPALIFISLTNILGMQVLVPMGKEKIVFCSVLMGAVVDMLINWLSIPICGIVGAATGTLIAELAVLIVQAFNLKSVMLELINEIDWWKLIIPALGAGTTVIAVKEIIMPVIIKLVVSFLLFISIYGIGLAVVKERLFVEVKNKNSQL